MPGHRRAAPRGAARAGDGVRAWLDDARRYPRHLLLGGRVAGLVAGRGPGRGGRCARGRGRRRLVLRPAARRSGCAARRSAAAVLGAGLVVALLAGAVGGHGARHGDRRDDADAAARAPGRTDGDVLEPPRTHGLGDGGSAPASRRLAAPASASCCASRPHGGVRGALAAIADGRRGQRASGGCWRSAPADAHERRRGAHAQISVDRLRADRSPARRRRRRARRRAPARGGGADRAPLSPSAAALGARDGARAGRRARRGRPRGLPRERSRASAGGERDERRAARRARARRRHAGRASASRGRLVLALAAIAAYVPLAGGGPSIQRAGVMGGGRPARDARRTAVVAVVRAAARRRGDARAEPAVRAGRRRVAAQLRRRRVAAGGRAAPRARRCAGWRRGRSPRRWRSRSPRRRAPHRSSPCTSGALSVVSVGANLLAAPVVAPVMWLGAIAATLGQVRAGAGVAARGARRPAARLPRLAGAEPRRACPARRRRSR